MNESLTVVYQKDENLWVAECVELPEANGQGATKQEALVDLQSAIAELFAYRRAESARQLDTSVETETLSLA